MRRIYEPDAYIPDADRDGYWRSTVAVPETPALTADRRAEVAVIGAGFTGLNAALALADRGVETVVLEAETPGFGASGRNGGFCCLGGEMLDAATLTRRHGVEAAAEWRRTQRAAIDLVADRLATHGIDADRHSDGEVRLAHRPAAWPKLEAEAAEVEAAWGVRADLIPRTALAERGLGGPTFHGGLHVPVGFALNPLKYLAGLVRAARGAGVAIHGRSPVTRLDRIPDGYRLTTPGGTVTAKRLVLATNGYSADDVPPWLGARYLPVQSTAMVTRPLTATETADQGWWSDLMAYDTRQLLHYFRLMPDGRVLFGQRGAVRATAAARTAITERMIADFRGLFPAWAEVGIDRVWSGLVCLARARVPYVGPLDDAPDAVAALAYHGNGVAMGSHAGTLAAAALIDGTPPPAVMSGPLAKFPFGSHRRAVLPPLYTLLRWQDGP